MSKMFCSRGSRSRDFICIITFAGDLIHLIGYIKPTLQRPPYLGTAHVPPLASNPYNPFSHHESYPSTSSHHRPPNNRPDYAPNFETNHIAPPSSVYSDFEAPVHHQIFDENGYPVNAIFNRPLYSDRPDPVFQEKPIYQRPTKKPPTQQTTLYDVAGTTYSNDESNGYQRSTNF